MLGQRAGVTGFCNPHAFRHGFAIEYLMNGGDLVSLSDLMGHESVQTTRDFYAVFNKTQNPTGIGRVSVATPRFELGTKGL